MNLQLHNVVSDITGAPIIPAPAANASGVLQVTLSKVLRIRIRYKIRLLCASALPMES
jgi:hypothetical protein